ncbi:Cap-specific mRNA (nucleoside-2'-O-)-methyltransferase 1, partial [Stegodyphus mimosarum]
MQGENLSYLKNHPELLTESNLKKLQNVFDFHCVATADPKPKENATLFLGLGRSYIYQYDPQNFKWSKVEVTLELPADTLFYGELVSELRGEGRAQRKITCLHIIDAICLGGKDVRKQHYENRMLLAEKLAKAVSKLSRTDYTCLRVKKVWLLSEIDQIFENLTMKYTKNSVVPRLCYDLGDGRHILPTGLLIFKTT